MLMNLLRATSTSTVSSPPMRMKVFHSVCWVVAVVLESDCHIIKDL